jgi:transglutaminase-like putative cysteine protease
VYERLLFSWRTRPYIGFPFLQVVPMSAAVVRAFVAFTALVVTAAARSGAQAPHITESGDPSVANDTIYKLTVDSAAYPEQTIVLLLDDGVIRVERDGSGSRTYRQVSQVLREGAIEGLQERQFSYFPDRQRLTVNWIRVLSHDGKVISDKPSQSQESDVPADILDPVYAHEKVLRVSLTGVAVGTLVDISYTIEDRAPFRVGDFFDQWGVTAGATVRRSRYLVDAPKDLALRIHEHHLTFARRETVVGDRRVYTWATSNVAWVRPELFQPPADSNDAYMSVAIAAPATWSDVGSWYAGLARDRQKGDEALRDTVRQIVAHATTLDDSLRAVHRWVAQDVRYVSISLGIGGYQPRTPATVLATGFGDCKDKATLFVAALSTIGVEAYPVLLSAGGRPDRALPTVNAFDHEIAAIKRPSGYEYVDLTSDLSRLGTLPSNDASQFGLLVHPDGTTEEVTTPPDPSDSNATLTQLVGTLSPTGIFNGRLSVSGSGASELSMRGSFRLRMDSTQRAALMRKVASTAFPNAKGDSLVVFDGKDLHAVAHVSLMIRDGQAAQPSGDSYVLAITGAGNLWNKVADELESRPARRMPIDAAAIMGAVANIAETRITLPEGWHARLPPSVTAESDFGYYQSLYRQEGRDLIIAGHAHGKKGIYPKSRIADLIAWMRDIGRDHTTFIVIDPK